MGSLHLQVILLPTGGWDTGKNKKKTNCRAAQDNSSYCASKPFLLVPLMKEGLVQVQNPILVLYRTFGDYIVCMH